jgi:hypothetical protein
MIDSVGQLGTLSSSKRFKKEIQPMDKASEAILALTSRQQSLKPAGVGGWVSAVDSQRRTIWIVDAHRDDGKRFVVRSEEKLTAFLELERITHEFSNRQCPVVNDGLIVELSNWGATSHN